MSATLADLAEAAKSNKLVMPDILDIRDKVAQLSENQLLKPVMRLYTSPNARPRTENCYCSLVMVNDAYIPGALTLAYSVHLSKTNCNLVCIVQDKPANLKIGNKYVDTGVSKEAIDALLELYDYVYGIDIIQVKDYVPPEGHFTRKVSYENISLYATKIYMYALTDYKRVLYLDASCYIGKNTDFVFDRYKQSTFRYDFGFAKSGVGLAANVMLVYPDLRYYTRGMLLVNRYYEIFKDYKFTRGVDELVLYYAVYPDWSKALLDNDYKCLIKKYVNRCYIYTVSGQKPFKKGVDNDTSLYVYYEIWDRISDMLLRRKPHLKKFYANIPKFRTHAITTLNN